MKTLYTKKCKRKYTVCVIISYLLCFGTAISMIVYGFATGIFKRGGSLEDKIGVIMYTFLLSIIPLVVLTLIAGRKVRPLVFMIDVVVANILFSSTGLYTMLMLWISDTYIFTPLAKYYKNKYYINKEIDKRNG